VWLSLGRRRTEEAKSREQEAKNNEHTVSNATCRTERSRNQEPRSSFREAKLLNVHVHFFRIESWVMLAFPLISQSVSGLTFQKFGSPVV
jgi:hypothetical protein